MDIRQRFANGFGKIASGTSLVTCNESLGKKVQDYKVVGNCVQSGTPTPASPLEIQQVGDRILPEGYDRVEYLESHGTEYIDTGIKPYSVSKWELDAQFTDLNIGSVSAFRGNGCYPEDVHRFDIGITLNNKFWMAIGIQNISVNADFNRHFFILDKENNRAYIDNTQLNFSALSWSSSPNFTICLANRTYYGEGSLIYGCKEKIFSSRLFDSNELLIRDLLPAKRTSDNVLGMYDLVSGTFYTNAGSGTFTAGPAMPNYRVECEMGEGEALPDEYQKVEYLQAGDNCHIETDILPRTDLFFKIKCACKSFLGVDASFFGADVNYNLQGYSLHYNPNPISINGANIHYGGSVKNNIFSPPFYFNNENDFATFEVRPDKKRYINGTQWQTSPNSDILTSDLIYPICLFGLNRSGTYLSNNAAWCIRIADLRLYSVSAGIEENEYHFIPCRRKSDSVLGMYDIVGNQFYTNAGTGNFTAGPDVVATKFSVDIDAPLRYINGYGDYIDFAEQKVVRNVGEDIIDGTETLDTWTTNVYGAPAPARTGYGRGVGICTHYRYQEQGESSGEGLFYPYGLYNYFFYNGTAEQFKTWLAAQYAAHNPVKVYFSLAVATSTPITLPALDAPKGKFYFKVNTTTPPSNTAVTFRSRTI